MARPHARTDLVALDRIVTTRLTESELELLRDSAGAHGLTVSAYVRLATIGTASLPPAVQETRLSTAGAAVM